MRGYVRSVDVDMRTVLLREDDDAASSVVFDGMYAPHCLPAFREAVRDGRMVEVEVRDCIVRAWVSSLPTLHEALDALGYRTRPSDQHGVRIVVDAAGAVVFRGRAREAWAWLRAGRPTWAP